MTTSRNGHEWRDIRETAGRVSKLTALGTSGVAIVVGIVLLAGVLIALLWG